MRSGDFRCNGRLMTKVEQRQLTNLTTYPLVYIFRFYLFVYGTYLDPP